MANYTLYTLGAGDISISGGGALSGYSQGDGTQLMGKTITLNAPNWQPIAVSDDDSWFADTDGSQVLTTAQNIFGTGYAAGRVVEAEYTLTVQDGGGNTFTVIGFNINEPGSPYQAYGTVEGLAFVGPPGSWPPVGTPLTVIATSEGPPNTAGPGAVAYDDYVAPICFVTGTRIATPGGARPVETLAAGDLVLTRDHGAQPLLWAGRTEVGGTLRAQRPEFAPVCIEPDALGPGLPARPLWLSRQHRVMLGGWRMDLHFGAPEVLVPAGALTDTPGIGFDEMPGRWSYHHLMCPAHEILSAEGVPCESFLPTDHALALLPPAMQLSLMAALPALARGCTGYGGPARPIVKRWEAAVMA